MDITPSAAIFSRVFESIDIGGLLLIYEDFAGPFLNLSYLNRATLKYLLSRY